jgi:hypothetical protein
MSGGTDVAPSDAPPTVDGSGGGDVHRLRGFRSWRGCGIRAFRFAEELVELVPEAGKGGPGCGGPELFVGDADGDDESGHQGGEAGGGIFGVLDAGAELGAGEAPAAVGQVSAFLRKAMLDFGAVRKLLEDAGMAGGDLTVLDHG